MRGGLSFLGGQLAARPAVFELSRPTDLSSRTGRLHVVSTRFPLEL